MTAGAFLDHGVDGKIGIVKLMFFVLMGNYITGFMEDQLICFI